MYRSRHFDWGRFMRDAPWLTPARAKAYCRILAILTVIIGGGWVALSDQGVDRDGHPLGSDFISFWAASHLALNGNPQAAYSPVAHLAAERVAVPSDDGTYTAFFYPPVFLLFCLPLAMLPYLGALVVWLVGTGAACWYCLRKLLPQRWAMLPIAAYPATLLNLGHGQNGFLSTACFGVGMLALARRPIIAGMAFGCLVFKPQLAVVVPFGLAAAKEWRALGAAVGSALGLCVLSWLAFGTATWQAFLGQTPMARVALEMEWVGSAKMVSIFAAARLLGGNVQVAYAAQIFAIVALLGFVYRIRKDRISGPDLGVLMASMTVFASPFLLDYDLMLLALPMAWLMASAQSGGFRPWEKIVLFVAFILPLVARTIGLYAGVPIAPLVLGALLAVISRRIFGSNRHLAAVSSGATIDWAAPPGAGR
jgi:alpha-1,2-mannosyltransferase